MNWLQIELRVKPEQLEDIEEVLLGLGANALTLLSDDDEPVLEPAPGETPLWSSIRLQALCPLDFNMMQLRLSVQEIDPGLANTLDVDFVANQDWQVAANNHAVNQVFANKLWLMPKDLDAGANNDLIELRLDPGLAFGSGSHPTTRLCLQWLAEHIHKGMRVLDFGCGSGVLGIAAALLGAQVVAVDHDDQAVMASLDNAAYNGVDTAQMQVMSLVEWEAMQPKSQFDAVVANILAAPLISLAAQFESLLTVNGSVVLSGILDTQAQSVRGHYQSTDFEADRTEAGWVCLVGHVRPMHT